MVRAVELGKIISTIFGAASGPNEEITSRLNEKAGYKRRGPGRK